MTFELNISVGDEGLKKIYAAHKSLTLVKNLSMTEGLLFGPPIAWLAFQPLSRNRITWAADYFVYATTAEVRPGAVININSQTPSPAQAGATYVFAQGHFAATAEGTAGAYTVNNQMPSDNFSFGLAQQANVNNVPTLAPLNAVPALSNEWVAFTPQETVSLFLSPYGSNGTVISMVSPAALSVALGGAQPAAEVAFNDQTNSFYLIS